MIDSNSINTRFLCLLAVMLLFALPCRNAVAAENECPTVDEFRAKARLPEGGIGAVDPIGRVNLFSLPVLESTIKCASILNDDQIDIVYTFAPARYDGNARMSTYFVRMDGYYYPVEFAGDLMVGPNKIDVDKYDVNEDNHYWDCNHVQ